MGLKTSPNSFQLLKNKVLNGLSFRYALCYLDDVGGGVLKNFKSLKDLQEFFDDFIQLD